MNKKTKTMKSVLILTISIISLNLFSQSQMNERRALKEKHIDFSKEYLYFELIGLIELNGIIFNNDTCNCPIIYKSTINTVELINKCSNQNYEFVKFITFGKKNIISITEPQIIISDPYQNGGFQLFQYDDMIPSTPYYLKGGEIHLN